MMQIDGGVAVVTGAASGIGRALVQEAVRRGMSVAAADIDEPQLATLAAEVGPERCLTATLDVSDEGQVNRFADQVLTRFGQVDLLCNNAGILHAGSVCETGSERWRRVVDINLFGVLYGVRAFLPAMLQRGAPAHIVNTASTAGLTATPMLGAYTVSKYGVVALSETLLFELQAMPAQIGVSVVCPGPVATQVARNASSTANAAQAMDWLNSGVAQGMPATDCAELIFEQAAAGRFWIFTHPEMLAAVDARTQGMHDPRAPIYVPPGSGS
jgi:NAD(P)-dependent dehydrogenase (short-subunit alcohol dehydrogenase family)